MYLEAAKRFIPSASRIAAESWGRQVVHKLMVATHKPWLFCNSRVRYKTRNGLTVQQHADISAYVKELLLVDPANLLPRHQYLMVGDFTDIGGGASVNR